MKSSALSLSCLSALCAFALGCGGGDDDPLNDPSTFVGKYRDAIDFNCDQIAGCDEQKSMPPAKGFHDDCVQQSADALNDNLDNQRRFVAKYIHCGDRGDPCSYTACLSLPDGYGSTQLPIITQSCQAEAACKDAQGMSSNNPAQEQVICEGKHVGALDSDSPDQRHAYEVAYPPCATLTSCEFITCFPY